MKFKKARLYIVGKVLQCSSKQLWLSCPTWCWDGSNVGIWERSTGNLVKIKDWQLAQNQVSSLPFKHTWVICGWCWMIKIVELCCEWFFGWFWENIGWERGDRWMEQDGRWKTKKIWLCVNKPQNCQKWYISNALQKQAKLLNWCFKHMCTTYQIYSTPVLQSIQDKQMFWPWSDKVLTNKSIQDKRMFWSGLIKKIFSCVDLCEHPRC